MFWVITRALPDTKDIIALNVSFGSLPGFDRIVTLYVNPVAPTSRSMTSLNAT